MKIGEYRVYSVHKFDLSAPTTQLSIFIEFSVYQHPTSNTPISISPLAPLVSLPRFVCVSSVYKYRDRIIISWSIFVPIKNTRHTCAKCCSCGIRAKQKIDVIHSANRQRPRITRNISIKQCANWCTMIRRRQHRILTRKMWKQSTTNPVHHQNIKEITINSIASRGTHNHMPEHVCDVGYFENSETNFQLIDLTNLWRRRLGDDDWLEAIYKFVSKYLSLFALFFTIISLASMSSACSPLIF